MMEYKKEREIIKNLAVLPMRPDSAKKIPGKSGDIKLIRAEELLTFFLPGFALRLDRIIFHDFGNGMLDPFFPTFRFFF